MAKVVEAPPRMVALPSLGPGTEPQSQGLKSPRLVGILRFLGALALALVGFAIVLLLQGRNPLEAYAAMLSTTLGTAFGRSEVIVKAIPLMLCALAVALPARVGLVNVGGEGQLYLGVGSFEELLQNTDWLVQGASGQIS